MNITATEAETRGRGARRFGFALACAGLVVMLAAMPAFMAGVLLTLDYDLRDRLLDGESLSAEETDAFIAGREAVLTFWPTAQTYDDLAMGWLNRAILAGLDKPEGLAAMAKVIELEQEGLSRRPADGFGWARLAYARLLYNGPSRLVFDALRKSIDSAPHERRLLVSRVAMLFVIRKYWPEGFAEQVPDHVMRAWHRQKSALLEIALKDGFFEDIAPVLAQDPVIAAELAKLEKVYRKKLNIPASMSGR